MRGRKPANLKTVDAITRAPAAPAWLSKEAKAEWKRIAPIMVERRTLTVADLPLLEQLCESSGVAHRASVELAASALIVDGKANPLIKIIHDATTRARLLASELGISVTARSRASVADRGGDDDEAADLGL